MPPGDAGRQLHQGVHPVPAGLRSLPPTLKLAGVHAQARGQNVPREAGGLLEGFEALGEVRPDEAVVDDEVGRKEAASHSTASRMNRSSKRVTPRASMRRLRISAEGQRVPDMSWER